MKKKLRRDILFFLIAFIRAFFSLFPYRVGFSFAATVGKIAFHILPKEKEKTLVHLRNAFGDEKSEGEIKKIGQAVFEHYGKILAEFVLIDKIIPRFDDFVTASGYENFDKALSAGKGVVVTIAHFGNWEIMGGYTALKGYPCTVIARKIYFEKYDRYIVAMREKMKVQTIYRDESTRTMLGILRKNGMLGFVVDQDVDSVEGIFVNFFNRPTYTPSAPVRFALASGAPIIPVFIVREGIHHHMFVETPIEISRTHDKARDIQLNTQKWVEVQEKYIRRYPHLWVWNHKRWKTQPEKMTENAAVI